MVLVLLVCCILINAYSIDVFIKGLNMKNIAEFIAEIENDNCSYSIWVYAQQGYYKQLNSTAVTKSYSYLKKIVESHMQIIVELNNDKPEHYLLLPEINVATHIAFQDQKVTAIAT